MSISLGGCIALLFSPLVLRFRIAALLDISATLSIFPIATRRMSETRRRRRRRRRR
jgi:hypothetical protein